ncbi:glycosyltransferase [Kineococcus sp. T90]|nr:glycosyltransferase [Kineococcus indalonis]
MSQPTTEGVARCVVDLVRHQAAEGWEVLLACPPGGDLATEAASAGAEVLPWSARRSPGPSVTGEAVRLRRAVREARPDVVHLHSAKAGLVGRAVLRGRVPTVYQPHAWSFLAVEGPVRAAALEWERRTLRWADRVLCVSRAELQQGLDADLALDGRAVVVPNGVDTARFAPGDRGAVRAELGLGDGPLAVCVGRLSRQKGQDVLLQAWSAVRSALPDAQLVLVGDGPERERLQARAPAGVRFAGRGEALPWYTAADCVVLASRWEGMALVPLEAGACARSVVVTDVAGAREAVPAAARSAVVPPEDPVALAQALAHRLGDRSRADAEGQLARRHVVDHHDVASTTAQVVEVYRGVRRGVRSIDLREPRLGSRTR